MSLLIWNKLWLRFVINDFDCRFGNKIFTLIQQTQIAIDAFKENKIRNQSVDILARQENQIPVAIADMQKRNISVKFLESIYCFCVIQFLGAKKVKAADII
jgi:hypothetical protein